MWACSPGCPTSNMCYGPSGRSDLAFPARSVCGCTAVFHARGGIRTSTQRPGVHFHYTLFSICSPQGLSDLNHQRRLRKSHGPLPTVHTLHSSSGCGESVRCCDSLVISDFLEIRQAPFFPPPPPPPPPDLSCSQSWARPGQEMSAPLEITGCNEGLTYQLPQGAPESSSAEGQPTLSLCIMTASSRYLVTLLQLKSENAQSRTFVSANIQGDVSSG